MRDSEEKEALKFKAIGLFREGVIIKEVCRQCGVADVFSWTMRRSLMAQENTT